MKIQIQIQIRIWIIRISLVGVYSIDLFDFNYSVETRKISSICVCKLYMCHRCDSVCYKRFVISLFWMIFDNIISIPCHINAKEGCWRYSCHFPKILFNIFFLFFFFFFLCFCFCMNLNETKTKKHYALTQLRQSKAEPKIHYYLLFKQLISVVSLLAHMTVRCMWECVLCNWFGISFKKATKFPSIGLNVPWFHQNEMNLAQIVTTKNEKKNPKIFQYFNSKSHRISTISVLLIKSMGISLCVVIGNERNERFKAINCLWQ